ncbi:MAG: hypothetical protein ACE145_04580 [Terriglobia bacterium]
MRWKDAAITLIALAAIALVSIVAYRREARPREDLCQVCQRALHAGVTYRLEMKDGRLERACCPRCGMHLQIQRPGAVARAVATDLPTGKEIPAEQASYVEGGDVEYCTMHSTPVEREPQGVRVREYDRCLPTLVAFRTTQEAEAYQRQHGGRVLNYEQAMESVRIR